ncbi:MAG: bifunctional 3,4-dihydroxy-2-butanone-4-phosphate synthase/GTP cyclohydrolase II [Bacteroidetes bacterium]|nr:bifunctional 3,4-dihydroxy-2-butanone-4-phosphate synthase/GTP cyclohydrolase II [Bacteroidota bacterium]
MQEIRLDSVESALEDIRQGKMILVVDDEDRENEGDMLIAAEAVTPEVINFMTKVGRGLVCIGMTEERCDELELHPMVSRNNSHLHTNFTVSVDYLKDGVTTGISAYDRARTIQALIDPATRPDELGRPGHIFPLRARKDGVLRRAGHTEAAVDLPRLVGMYPAGVIVEVLNEDGTMARLPELRKLADAHGMKLISIEELIQYRLKRESLVEEEEVVDMPTRHGHFRLHAFKHKYSGEVHMALVKGEWAEDEPVMVRVHSSCVTGDIFHSFRCDCGEQLAASLEMVETAGKGVVLYMNQEGRGIGLINKLHAYKLQEEGYDTVEANLKLGFKMDQREYGIGAQILRSLGVRKMRLLTNNPKKRTALLGYDLEIVEQIPIEMPPNAHNLRYLETKRDKMGHGILGNHPAGKD